VADNGDRTISTSLIWTDTQDSNNAVASALILNDSNNSGLGAGVWLDTAVNLLDQPYYDPVITVPYTRFTKQTRLFDPGYYKRFGVTLYGLGGVVANTIYHVDWTAPPGPVTQDNAMWEIFSGVSCGAYLCSYFPVNCYVTSDYDPEWPVGVIEAGADLSFSGPWKCYNWYFLPFVKVD
jgi:hypothetical protein